MNIATIIIDDKEAKFPLSEKTFKTGSRGYHGQGKMNIGDKRFQCNILAIEIGRKAK